MCFPRYFKLFSFDWFTMTFLRTLFHVFVQVVYAGSLTNVSGEYNKALFLLNIIPLFSWVESSILKDTQISNCEPSHYSILNNTLSFYPYVMPMPGNAPPVNSITSLIEGPAYVFTATVWTQNNIVASCCLSLLANHCFQKLHSGLCQCISVPFKVIQTSKYYFERSTTLS